MVMANPQSLAAHPELKKELLPLTEAEYGYLEQSLKAEGCRDPLILWDHTLIDGYHRYEICLRHHIPFQIITREFKDLEEAREWVVRNQLARRNLSAWDKAQIVKRLEPALREKAKKNQSLAGGDKVSAKVPKSPLKAPKALCPISVKALDVKKELAKASGLSHDTIRKARYIEKHREAAPEMVKRLDAGDREVTINSVYRYVKNQVQPPKPRLKRRWPKGYMEADNLTSTQMMNIVRKIVAIFELRDRGESNGAEKEMKLLKRLLTS